MWCSNNIMRRQKSTQDASNTSFLEKFEGKATKIGKQGILGLINGPQTEVTKQLPMDAKRPSMYRSQMSRDSFEYQQRKINLDDLLGTPQAKDHPSRLKFQTINSQYVPSFSRDSVQSQRFKHRTPESNSSRRQQVKKSQFGESKRATPRPNFLYETLLSEDALKHFQLLSTIQRRFKLKY